MTSYQIGQRAEASAAGYLQRQGFKIIHRNWRNRYCEIDIVASKNQTIYFVEAKYRRSLKHGAGLDYITTAKLKRMRFAAELWVKHFKWRGQYRLAAIELSGSNYFVNEFLELD